MRSRFLISTAISGLRFAALSAAGCTPVGDGTGAAHGLLWIHGCDEGKDVGTDDCCPSEFDLQAHVLRGRADRDISGGPPQNRLIIRMQRNGNAIQINDTLYVDIPDSFEVARACAVARSRTCRRLGHEHRHDRSAGACPSRRHGASRPDRPAFRASTSSRSARCACRSRRSDVSPRRRAGPTVVAVTGVAKDGWIDFLEFGSATPAEADHGARHARRGRQQVPGGLRRPPAREFPGRAGGRPRGDGAVQPQGAAAARTSAARSTASSTSISGAVGRGQTFP